MRGQRFMTWAVVMGVAVAVPAVAQEGRSDGPPFCREGDGHPVHGRTWCVQKGFRLGANTVWREADWGGLTLRSVRQSGSIPQTLLEVVVGAEVLDRLEDQRRRLDAGSAMSARWLAAEGGGTVLQVFSGRTPIAELADWNRDGRVDLLLLNHGLRQHDPRFTR